MILSESDREHLLTAAEILEAGKGPRWTREAAGAVSALLLRVLSADGRVSHCRACGEPCAACHAIEEAKPEPRRKCPKCRRRWADECRCWWDDRYPGVS